MRLELRQKQKQILTEKMIQSVEILQMTSQELKEYVNEVMLENPVVELDEHVKENTGTESIEERQQQTSAEEQYHYLTQRQSDDDDISDLKNKWNVDPNDEETLQDYLWSQLLWKEYSDRDEKILKFILDSLDDRGYLTDTVEDIVDSVGETKEHVIQLIEEVRALEPAGVAAMDLQQCLQLQLQRRGELDHNVEKLVTECLPLLGENKIPQIAKKMKLPIDEVLVMCERLKTLTPKPGGSFSNRQQMKYIIPDVIVVKFKEYYDILLNDWMYADISISPYYSQMQKNNSSQEVKDYLEQKIKQANWVKQSIEQRNTTLLKVVRAIVVHQKDFFEHGSAYLKPYRLADAAEEIGIHESTVSRAVNKKYLQCSQGIFPLSYFFVRGMQENAEQSSAAIKGMIRELIRQENKKKPYSDAVITKLLNEKGIQISRRTVAKYRDQEGIPGASGRKDWKQDSVV